MGAEMVVEVEVGEGVNSRLSSYDARCLSRLSLMSSAGLVARAYATPITKTS